MVLELAGARPGGGKWTRGGAATLGVGKQTQRLKTGSERKTVTRVGVTHGCGLQWGSSGGVGCHRVGGGWKHRTVESRKGTCLFLEE